MKKTEPKDYGTVEIARQFTVVPKLSGPNSMTMRVMDDTEMDRLLLRNEISIDQHATLEAFMRRMHKMGFVGVKSPDYQSPIHLDPSLVGDRRANSVRGMVRIFKRLDEKTKDPDKRRALVNLCLLDMPWPYAKKDLHDCIAALNEVMVR